MVTINMAQNNELESMITRWHVRDSAGQGITCRDRTAIDQNSTDIIAAAIFNPQTITMIRRQHLDREEWFLVLHHGSFTNSLQSASPNATRHNAIGRLSSSAFRFTDRKTSPNR